MDHALYARTIWTEFEYHCFRPYKGDELQEKRRLYILEALNLYRNKDLIEKSFVNLKERLNFRRALVSSAQSLNGKMFVQFIALIYLSYIKKQIEEHYLFKDYTIQGLLDELDMIKCVYIPGKRLHVAEVLKKHKALYQAMEVPPPISL